MTAPVTKVAILYTGTALLFNSLRGTHRQSQILFTGTALLFNSLRDTHTDSRRFCAQGQRFFVYDTHENSRFCAQGLNLCSTILQDAQIICTETAFSFSRLRGCIRFE